MFRLLKLMERNLRRNLRRTILTTLTIALATFIFTMLISVPASMDRLVNDASTGLRLVINNKSAPWEDLPARYCGDIRTMPGVVACVAMTGWVGTYRNQQDPIVAYAVGPENPDVYPDYDPAGEHRRAAERERRAVFVGGVLMEKERWQVGQLITLRGTDAGHMNLSFIILGVIKSKHYPNAFVIRRDYLMEARKAAGYPDADVAWDLIVRCDRAEHLSALARLIDDHFRNSDYQTRTVTESDALAAGLSEVGNVRAIILTLGFVVILTVLLIAANSTAMMVRERISEVAIMRALGFSRGRMAFLLVGECAAIGLAGGLLGSLAAWRLFAGGITLGAVLGGNGALWITAQQAFAALAAAVAVGLVSGIGPIAEALSVSPAMAFRKVV